MTAYPMWHGTLVARLEHPPPGGKQTNPSFLRNSSNPCQNERPFWRHKKRGEKRRENLRVEKKKWKEINKKVQKKNPKLKPEHNFLCLKRIAKKKNYRVIRFFE